MTSEGRRSPKCSDELLPISVQRIRSHTDLKEARSSVRDGGLHPSAQELDHSRDCLYVQISQVRP